MRNDIVQMFNNKLYRIRTFEIGIKLSVTVLETGCDYKILDDNFTGHFTKINSSGEFYEIIDMTMYEIPIIAINSSAIIKLRHDT
jgi:hypothetical protein